MSRRRRKGERERNWKTTRKRAKSCGLSCLRPDRVRRATGPPGQVFSWVERPHTQHCAYVVRKIQADEPHPHRRSRHDRNWHPGLPLLRNRTPHPVRLVDHIRRGLSSRTSHISNGSYFRRLRHVSGVEPMRYTNTHSSRHHSER